jgi:hypothetical protein
MMRFMSDESPSNKFFKEGRNILQNMQDNIQERKCKIFIEQLKKRTLSTEYDEIQCQHREHNSDDE